MVSDQISILPDGVLSGALSGSARKSANGIGGASGGGKLEMTLLPERVEARYLDPVPGDALAVDVVEMAQPLGSRFCPR